jgi:hypothetical protein
METPTVSTLRTGKNNATWLFCAAANAHEGFTAPFCSYAPAGSDGCP